MSDGFQPPAMQREDERVADERGLTCDFAGHEWRDAGGGLEICLLCEAEQWGVDVPRDSILEACRGEEILDRADRRADARVALGE